MCKETKLEIRPSKPGEAGYVSYLQMTLYQKKYRFRPVFEKYLLSALTQYVENPEGSRLWVALDQDRIVGSIAICKADKDTAQLRWFAIDEAYQGKGLGNQLVGIAMNFCREQGYRHVYLWTIDILGAARHLYGKYGFQHTEDKPNDEWTGSRIMEERWDYNEPVSFRGAKMYEAGGKQTLHN